MEVISVNGLSKLYRLGEVGTGTLAHDLNRWWARARGKEDPFSKVGRSNDRTAKGNGRDYVWALKDLNFSVGQGDVVAIIGRNGAGKSTLLKIISRITAPTKGNISIKGRIASLLEVGTGFHPEMTGRENIFMNGTLLGMTKAEITGKFDEIVDFAGVSLYLDTPVKRYSSGMMVRLGFAVAAFLEPEILVVDEVLAVGDAEFQRKALGRMQHVSRKEGRTVLFVSHNMGSVQTLCTRGIVLDNGTSISYGKVQDAVQCYLQSKSTLTPTSISLRDRRDRSGNGKTRITNIAFYDVNTHQWIDKLYSGQDVEIQVTYESDPSVKVLNHLNLGVTFFDNNNTFKTVLNNEMAGFILCNLSPTGTIICRLKSVPFMYGNLTLTTTMKVNGVLEDRVEAATSIFVEEGDYYGTGIPNSFQREGIYVNQSFRHEDIG